MTGQREGTPPPRSTPRRRRLSLPSFYSLNLKSEEEKIAEQWAAVREKEAWLKSQEKQMEDWVEELQKKEDALQGGLRELEAKEKAVVEAEATLEHRRNEAEQEYQRKFCQLAEREQHLSNLDKKLTLRARAAETEFNTRLQQAQAADVEFGRERGRFAEHVRSQEAEILGAEEELQAWHDELAQEALGGSAEKKEAEVQTTPTVSTVGVQMDPPDVSGIGVQAGPVSEAVGVQAVLAVDAVGTQTGLELASVVVRSTEEVGDGEPCVRVTLTVAKGWAGPSKEGSQTPKEEEEDQTQPTRVDKKRTRDEEEEQVERPRKRRM